MLKPGAGKRIKDAREAANLSRPALSSATKVSVSTIANIETGENTSPLRRTVLALANHLHLDEAELLTAEESAA